MKIETLACVVLFSLAFISSAHAGIWDNLGAITFSRPTRVLQLPQTEITSIQESPVTQTGRIVKFDVAFPRSYYDGGTAGCRATIVNVQNNRLFVATFTAFPAIRGDEPWVAVSLLRQAAVCLWAQHAFLRGQNVTVTGLLQPPQSSTQVPNALPVYSVQRFFAVHEGGGTSVVSGLPPRANICNQIGCQADGMVTGFSYDLGEDRLCTASMTIPSQNNNTAEAQIDLINKEFCRDNDGCSTDELKQMYGRFLACQLLESAFENSEPVTVLGYGAINGHQVQAVAVTIDKPLTAEPIEGNPSL